MSYVCQLGPFSLEIKSAISLLIFLFGFSVHYCNWGYWSPLLLLIALNFCLQICQYLLPWCSVQSLSRVQLFATHGLQHARPPCPSPTPRVHQNPCPLSRWCHPTISSSVFPFSSCPQSFPASGVFSKWVSSSHQVAKVLEFQLQHQSFQWTPRTDFL